MKKFCIIIVGPTAVGKTGLSLQLAKNFSTEIISADSRQCYKELDIGVAKPSQAELAMVPHHFIDSHSIQEEVNAAIFEQYALQKIDLIFFKTQVAIMVGGTGLYVKAFCEGMNEMPVVLPEIRKNISDEYEQKGLPWLQKEIAGKDQLFYSKGEILNPQRMMRALEVKLSTGRSILEFQTNSKKQRSFEMIRVGLEMPRELLYQNINNRVDSMIEKGLLKEAGPLYSCKSLNALQTVGYRELFQHFDGEINLENAVSLIKQNTRHYAKRQMTWFKKDETINWFDVSKSDTADKIVHFLEKSMTNEG